MHVKIYAPAKGVTQSGRGKTQNVILEPDIVGPRRPEPVMGWVSSMDTLNQVRLTFPTVQAAVQHAVAAGWTYTVVPAAVRRVKPRNYTDNFKPILTVDTVGSKGSAQETC